VSQIEWLTLDDILQIHNDQIERYGGLKGLRDMGALEGCLARPRNLSVYSTPDIFDLAAGYSFGIAKNHCFIDGNKRTALVAAAVFLLDNEFLLSPSFPAAAQLFEDVAAGLLGEAEIAEFFRMHSLLLADK